jgi:hypothetical protein
MNPPEEPATVTPAPVSLGALTTPGRLRFTTRFALVYGALTVVLIASTAAFVIFLVNGSSGWSNWHPSPGTTAVVTKEIADHVASEYKTSAGAELVAVVPSPPAVTIGTRNIAITAVAAHTSPSPNSNVRATLTDDTETYTFCGLEAFCSLSGTPTVYRGQLIRREALETALYTFKYLPSINSVIAFMPASKVSPLRELLYLRKQDMTRQLKQPLDKTLTLATPPPPPSAAAMAANPKLDPDAVEQPTIDQLTLHRIFTYTFTDLQSNGALLILSPLF